MNGSTMVKRLFGGELISVRRVSRLLKKWVGSVKEILGDRKLTVEKIR